MELNSCLYEVDVTHYRVSPKKHKFSNRIFMFYLDLDEMDELDKNLWLFGRNHRSIFEFRDSDHMEFDSKDIKKNIIKYVSGKGVTADIKRVMLLTNVRTCGYIFNPVSFYYCFDQDDKPICAVCEVGNTFGELKPFFLGPESFEDGKFSSIQKKYYYVSPFIELDVPMDFQIKVPGKKLHIRIDDLKENKKFLYATMVGSKQPLTNKNLLFYGIKFPFITFKVIFLIHYHAAILHFIKKIPYHKKEDNPHLQKEVQRVYTKKKTKSNV